MSISPLLIPSSGDFTDQAVSPFCLDHCSSLPPNGPGFYPPLPPLSAAREIFSKCNPNPGTHLLKTLQWSPTPPRIKSRIPLVPYTALPAWTLGPRFLPFLLAHSTLRTGLLAIDQTHLSAGWLQGLSTEWSPFPEHSFPWIPGSFPHCIQISIQMSTPRETVSDHPPPLQYPPGPTCCHSP